jgi:tetratricopeptide (TPR) repeat protein
VVGCGFLGLDDPQYVTSNAHVQGGVNWSGSWWAFTAFHASNWHPLTWLSQMLDTQLFGKSATGPHLVNLLLHVCNTLLVFALLRRLTATQWRAALVAGLFAVHPLRVESVAWISERKDVLSACFGLLALIAYVQYAKGKTTGLHDHGLQGKGDEELRTSNLENRARNARSPSEVQVSSFGSRSAWYWFALFFFALGLMSKPMLVTLPFTMLLLDYWPLGRFGDSRFGAEKASLPSLIREKGWFFLLAAASSVITFVAQRRGGAVQSLTDFSAMARAENALVSYGRYVGKTVWPLNLAMPYPHPGQWGMTAVALAAALVAVWLLGAVWLRRGLPFLTVGSLWFLGMLVPVLGLVQVGGQSMADRYTYLPQIGLWIALVWGAATLNSRWRLTSFIPALAAVLALACCALLTRAQIRYWTDTETLLRHTIAVTDANCLAHYDLGAYFDSQGRVDEAITCYRKALDIYPDFIRAHNSLADDLLAGGKAGEALFHYREVCRLDPKFAPAHNNYGAALAREGRFDEAIESHTKALRLEPDYAEAHYNLALALATERRFSEAVPHYLAAVRRQPKGLTYNNLGYALAALDRDEEALAAYRKAVELDPRLPEAYVNLGNGLARHDDLAGAEKNYQRALGLDSNNPAILNNLGHVLARQQRYAEAVTAYEGALRLAPRFDLARFNLGAALMAAGHPDLAAAQYRELLAADNGNPQAHYELARALADLGRREEAVAEATEALRLRPAYEEAREFSRALGAAKSR